MKAVLVVGDGMGDRPVEELDGKTPLQVAKKPNMDRIARSGTCGMMDPISPGISPGSDTAHLALFGYDPHQVYEGRGIFEALGTGIKVEPGDISFRCNLATVDEHMTVLDRRAGRIMKGGKALARALNHVGLDFYPDIKVFFKHSVEHRCSMVLRGPFLSRMVSDSDPHHDNFPIQIVRPCDATPEALRTANILNELTRKFHGILESHPTNIKRKSRGLLPANAILFRGAATLPKMRPITEIYGIKALIVSGEALTKGVCKAVGMDDIKVRGATGTLTTDVLAKAKATVENLPKYDFIYVHVKGTDSASHDGDVKQKIMMIEKIDALLGHILENADLNELIIAVTADHTTPVSVREHTGDPVPLAITGPGVRVDPVESFSEIDCAKGDLGRIRGLDLTPILMDLIGKAKKFGE